MAQPGPSNSQPRPAKTSSNSKQKRSSNSKLRAGRTPDQPPLPGVAKLKAGIRQTKRLLAMENLNAALRVQSERRLRSLEEDLEKSQKGKAERDMAKKYHMVKFFERQKVMRKVVRADKDLSAARAAGKTSNKTMMILEAALMGHRVDLNYILHYPKSKKYVSLLKATSPPAEKQREEMRAWVRGCMQRGEMSATPEEELGVRKSGKVARWNGAAKADAGVAAGEGQEGWMEEADDFFDVPGPEEEVEEDEDDDEDGEEDDESE